MGETIGTRRSDGSLCGPRRVGPKDLGQHFGPDVGYQSTARDVDVAGGARFSDERAGPRQVGAAGLRLPGGPRRRARSSSGHPSTRCPGTQARGEPLWTGRRAHRHSGRRRRPARLWPRSPRRPRWRAVAPRPRGGGAPLELRVTQTPRPGPGRRRRRGDGRGRPPAGPGRRESGGRGGPKIVDRAIAKPSLMEFAGAAEPPRRGRSGFLGWKSSIGMVRLTRDGPGRRSRQRQGWLRHRKTPPVPVGRLGLAVPAPRRRPS